MASKKKAEATSSQSDDYIEIKLPKVSPANKSASLILLLLVITFFAGFQTAKVTYWEQKEKALGTLTGAQGAQPTPTPSFYKVGNGHLPSLGKDSAKITIVEFSDLQCLFCRRFWSDTLPQLKKEYIDKGLVKLVYRHYPLPATLHPAARDLAEASECANDQRKFWEFHDEAFKQQALKGEGTISITTDDISNYASGIGLDMTTFTDCFSNKKEAKKIDADMADGQKVNVSSTPTFFINGQIVVGALPFASFKTIIDEQLKK
jgi:protein-disulfide isomerase